MSVGYELINTDPPNERMTLQNLPYDLLLNVAQHLELRDINAVQLVRAIHRPLSKRRILTLFLLDL